MLIEEGKPHPIFGLMKRAKERWRVLNQRQSKTFGEAVGEYRRRYGRNPPKGFDRWCVESRRSLTMLLTCCRYAFARYHNVQLIECVSLTLALTL